MLDQKNAVFIDQKGYTNSLQNHNYYSTLAK